MSGPDLTKGIWDQDGFAQDQLLPPFAAELYLQLGKPRWLLHGAMMELEQAGGFVSLDHVMDPAKRIQDDSSALLMACGASGNVLAFKFCTSTSLAEVADDLAKLNSRQTGRNKVLVVTVDDPISMQAALSLAFPDADIKMDVGHIMFSRIGKLLNKIHTRYGELCG